MCGIVGYTGERDCVDILIKGLKNLEYRGYDSAGIAVINSEGNIEIEKKQGRVSVLEQNVGNIKGCCGIGHTRWATHGRPSDINSHPHFSGKFAVVHNGIIENFLELKIQLVNEGVKFLSETDTEVIAHLLNKYYNGNFILAVRDVLNTLKGAYALAIVCSDYPNQIAVVKKDNPLIIGVKGKECFIASDIPAISNKADKLYILKDGEMALCDKGKIDFYNKNLDLIERKFDCAEVIDNNTDKGLYESYMIKEINEIPIAILKTYSHLCSLDIPNILLEKLKICSFITIVACGTAYNSGLVAKHLIEKFSRIKVNVEIASEFRYKNPIIDKDEIIIAVSQSGETADTLAAVKLANEYGAYTIAITNASQSSITTYANFSFTIKAGVEIAVAATKSYNCQLVAFYFLCDLILKQKNIGCLPFDAEKISKKAQEIIACSEKLVDFAGHFSNAHSVFFIGRGMDYSVAIEGSLKLKEISYIHSEGYASGELKHGTLALIEKNTLVVVLMTDKELAAKTLNALHEVKARGATVLVLSQFKELNEDNDLFFELSNLEDYYMPIIEVIPLQIFAYFMARSRGLDADKPRNLAKSVTVE